MFTFICAKVVKLFQLFSTYHIENDVMVSVTVTSLWTISLNVRQIFLVYNGCNDYRIFLDSKENVEK